MSIWNFPIISMDGYYLLQITAIHYFSPAEGHGSHSAHSPIPFPQVWGVTNYSLSSPQAGNLSEFTKSLM
jgi:hypothetical protein